MRREEFPARRIPCAGSQLCPEEFVLISSPMQGARKHISYFAFCQCFYYHKPLFLMSKSNEFSYSSLGKKGSSIVVFDLFFIASIISALIRKWHILCVPYFTSCLCIILTEARRYFTLRLVGFLFFFFFIYIITMMARCALVFFIPAKWRWEVNSIILQLHRQTGSTEPPGKECWVLEETDLTGFRIAGFGEHSLQFSQFLMMMEPTQSHRAFPLQHQGRGSSLQPEMLQRPKPDLLLLCAGFKVEQMPLLCAQFLQKFWH